MPEGTRLGVLTDDDSDAEFLLPRDTKLMIDDVRETDQGVFIQASLADSGEKYVRLHQVKDVGPNFDEAAHPRDRLGRFRNKLDVLDWARGLGVDAHVVGGAVRDELLGRQVKDYDFMVPGMDMDSLRAKLEESGRVEDLIVGGRTVGFRAYPRGGPAGGIEVAPPRREISTGPGRQDFDIVPDPEASVEEDAKRRDFTVNALYKKLSAETPQRLALDIAEVRGVQTTTRVFAAYKDGHPIGVLTVDEQDNTVELAFVQEEFRRQGVATRLLDAARRKTGLTITHRSDEVSPDGRAWSSATGLLDHEDEYDDPSDVPVLTPREATAFGSRLMVAINPRFNDLKYDKVEEHDSDEIIDPLGGVQDLKDKLLRTTSEDSFRDDPLRMMRALRFMSSLNFNLHKDTYAQMREHADAITEVSGERIGGGIEGAQGELTRMLKGDGVLNALITARDTGILGRILPELEPTFDFDQQSNYHSMDVDEHIFRAVDAGRRLGASDEVLMALLLHDSGKPESAWMGEDNRLHYYSNPKLGKDSHEEISVRKAMTALDRLKYPNAFKDKVVRLIDGHMFSTHKQPTPAKARRFLSKHGDLTFDLLNHKRADIMAKRDSFDPEIEAELAQIDRLEAMIREQQNQPVTLGDLAINGQDLIAAGYKPGPIFRELLGYLLNQVLGNPKLNDKEWLLESAARWMKENDPDRRVEAEPELGAFDTGRWYHVTPTSRIPKIMAEGLLPKDDNTSGHTTRANLSADSVYLFPKLSDAERWVEYARGRGWARDWTILQVDGVDPGRLAPDPELFDYPLRYFGYQKRDPDHWPNKVAGDEPEFHLTQALDEVFGHVDAVGGPERVSLREWLSRQPDQDQWVWVPSSPSEQYPDWFDPEHIYAPHLRLIAEMPRDMRISLAEWFARNDIRSNSVMARGAIPVSNLTVVANS